MLDERSFILDHRNFMLDNRNVILNQLNFILDQGNSVLNQRNFIINQGAEGDQFSAEQVIQPFFGQRRNGLQVLPCGHSIDHVQQCDVRGIERLADLWRAGQLASDDGLVNTVDFLAQLGHSG